MAERAGVTGPNAPAFGRASDHLRALAGVMAQYPSFKSPAKSRAVRESHDQNYDGAWGRATFELLHDPGPRITVVTDHLHALGAVTDAPETVLAIATLVRPTLEALGTLWWLYEPDIDTRERVRRRYNIRLASLVEQWNFVAGMDEKARTAVEERLAEAEETADALGFRFVKAKSRFDGVLGPRYLDSQSPSEASLITAVVESGEVRGLGRFIHRTTSAVIHGQSHAILPFIVDHRDSRDPGVALAQLGLTLRWYSLLTAPVALACNVTMLRLINHFGWSRGRWDRVAQPAVIDWRDWLNAE